MDREDVAGPAIGVATIGTSEGDRVDMDRTPRPALARSRRGFTLVDVVVSTVLFVVGLLSLANVAVTIQSLRRADEEKKLALTALLEELRAIETTPFQDLVATHDGRGFTVFVEGAAAPAFRPLPADPDGMPGIVVIETPDPPGDPGLLLEALVTLEWEGSFGPQRLSRRIRVSRAGADP